MRSRSSREAALSPGLRERAGTSMCARSASSRTASMNSIRSISITKLITVPPLWQPKQ